MEISEDLFRAALSTKGRKTSRIHTVVLRAVKYNGKLYFSRHRPDSDWFKNALANPKVTVNYKGKTYAGNAKLVEDQRLNEKISQLKYPEEDRAKDKRVSIEVTLCE